MTQPTVEKNPTLTTGEGQLPVLGLWLGLSRTERTAALAGPTVSLTSKRRPETGGFVEDSQPARRQG
jgi:hypothetical protein